MKKVGFIGCGNMGGALAAAASKYGECELYLADFSKEKSEELADKLAAKSATNAQIAAECDYIFLGVKPQIMPNMLAEISEVLKNREDRFVLVSMAAGLAAEKIRSFAGGDYPIIRIMPNTPVSVGRGMVVYCSFGVSEEEENIFLKFMSGAGRFDKIPENMIDAASAVSGCGPAFVCQFIEALSDGAVACGLPRDKALFYAAATLDGTAHLMLESGRHPAMLKDAVCSPAGSTIEGVRRLERGAFRSDVTDAVVAAYERTKELGK